MSNEELLLWISLGAIALVPIIREIIKEFYELKDTVKGGPGKTKPTID